MTMTMAKIQNGTNENTNIKAVIKRITSKLNTFNVNPKNTNPTQK
jgi:hypothetical protein